MASLAELASVRPKLGPHAKRQVRLSRRMVFGNGAIGIDIRSSDRSPNHRCAAI